MVRLIEYKNCYIQEIGISGLSNTTETISIIKGIFVKHKFLLLGIILKIYKCKKGIINGYRLWPVFVVAAKKT